MGLRVRRSSCCVARSVAAATRARRRPAPRSAGCARRGGERRAGRGGGPWPCAARDVLRPLPPAARARPRRPRRRGGLDRAGRSRLGAVDAVDAPARSGLHGADRPLHGTRHALALAGACAALEPLPRRRPRTADAARVQPRPGAGFVARRHRQIGTGGRRCARSACRFSPALCSSSPPRSVSHSSP